MSAKPKPRPRVKPERPATQPAIRPCHRCRYKYDVDALGRYGCPNCHGEGLE